MSSTLELHHVDPSTRQLTADVEEIITIPDHFAEGLHQQATPAQVARLAAWIQRQISARHEIVHPVTGHLDYSGSTLLPRKDNSVHSGTFWANQTPAETDRPRSWTQVQMGWRGHA